jgi:hypothetical protein
MSTPAELLAGADVELSEDLAQVVHLTLTLTPEEAPGWELGDRPM